MNAKMKENIEIRLKSVNSALASPENGQFDRKGIVEILFCELEEQVKKSITELHNAQAPLIFEANGLCLVSSDEFTFNKNHKFLKPNNLLPLYKDELSPIKFSGTLNHSQERDFLLNPYFFGFLISYNIYIHSLHCAQYEENLDEQFVDLLIAKFGNEFKLLYDYVAYSCYESYLKAEKLKDINDRKDEKFTSEILNISGLNDLNTFYTFVHYPTMIAVDRLRKVFVKLDD